MLERLMTFLGGPALVLIAALLWGTDSLYRLPTASALDPTFIVWIEHVVGILLLCPWIWLKQRNGLFKLGWKGWLCATIAGGGGGAIATVLFTAAFRYLNPSVIVLLQKLQPLVVVTLAYFFLGERPERKFYLWAPVALAAGFVLSFPDLDVSFLREKDNLHARGMSYTLIACGIWGVATVAGRYLLTRVSSSGATFWRYFFGTAMLSAILMVARIPLDFGGIFTGPASHDTIIALGYLSVFTGIIPMLVYYAGMKRTPASVVTFVELAYPISAVILNTLILHTPLTPIQMGAGGVLLFAVTLISL